MSNNEHRSISSISPVTRLNSPQLTSIAIAACTCNIGHCSRAIVRVGVEINFKIQLCSACLKHV